MSFKMAVQFFFWIFLVGSSQALTCYETTKDGDMIEITSETFKYCALAPEHFEGDEYVEGKAFGIEPETEPTEAYDRIFKMKNGIYEILSICIYEKFDFGNLSPRFAMKEPEFMLRCFCNFDRCNVQKNFFEYIESFKAKSAPKSKHVF